MQNTIVASPPTIDDTQGLYTPAMLAELLGVPVAAVRRWHRRGYLHVACEVRRLPYFGTEEVHVARILGELLAAGCSLVTIDRKMDELTRLLPDASRPLAELPVVVEGRRILLRRGADLAEPNGQLLLDFDTIPNESAEADDASERAAIPIAAAAGGQEQSGSAAASEEAVPAEALRELAVDLDSQGDRRQAIEAMRSLLISGQATAEDHFTLGELLYRNGDLAGARERYYIAIELDEDFVEARANLGCVLAESHEWELAEAALRGALAYHDDYADAHFHMARLLDQQQRRTAATHHWRKFLELAPKSPWFDEAQERLAAGEPC